ncbi:acyltransferase [Vibrio vulnificus]|nr:acyltransferase [Vibrio vulnificus]
MNQFKANNKRSLLDRIVSRYYRKKLGLTDNSIMFDAFVHIMRFPNNITLKSGVYVKGGVRLCPCNVNASICIGENTTIGYNTFVFSSGSITIGDNCMIAPNVYIVDSDHGTQRDYEMNKQQNIIAPVVIENDVWVGTGAVILKGTYIPQGCIIAANAVVKGKLEPYSIYAGIPAKKIGERK